MSITVAGESALWSFERQREREKELIFAGDQIRTAIAAFYESTPGSVKRYPRTLADLLEDTRHLPARRYLRRIYLDPMTGQAAWGLLSAPDGGIMGVHSASLKRPIKQAEFSEDHVDFAGKLAYTGWQFVYRGEQVRYVPATMHQWVPEPAR